MEVNFIGVLVVVGICWTFSRVTSKKHVEAERSRNIVGNYRPMLRDVRLNDGGRTFVPNILNQPVEGTV